MMLSVQIAISAETARTNSLLRMSVANDISSFPADDSLLG
jgi:hypothetical protein